MYTPAHFAADDGDALIARLARRGPAVLVTVDADGDPVGSHLPVLWDAERKLVAGHIARANPQWRISGPRGLILLSGPQAYVSPGWYPSKAEHGKVVPTWNYEAVHLSGPIEWFDDAVRLEALVRALSDLYEAAQPKPWSIDDAPRPYIETMMRGIVGVSLTAERIEAKRKFSQNKGAADFNGVAAGLAESVNPEDQEVAARMRATRAAADDPEGN